MKKITIAAIAVFLFGSLNAQIFSDNFESYALGTHIGPQSPQWRTWSATGEGTAEDVVVNNLQASSGSQSTYFTSTSANGGPQDVVLDFGIMYTGGIFTYESDFYVNTGKTAYFNFQGNNTIGGLYALDVYMDNGTLSFQSGGETKLSTSYPQGTWFTLTIECNLSTKIWGAKINGVSQGNWLNPVNSVRYLDLYPILNSQFYVDDVSFDQTGYVLSNLNAAAATLDIGGFIVGQSVNPSLVVVNAGTTPITSFDVSLVYNGTTLTENVTGVNIASLGTSTVNFNSTSLIVGSNNAVATISNVNGATDDVATDNTTQIIVNPIIPAAGKMVVGEEGTGTWCQWCPRGAVYMDRFEEDFAGFWAGVAVHNGDPMAVVPYDDGMNFSGYPSAKVDRVGAAVDPSGMGTPFFTRLQVAPTAFIEVGATYNSTTRELKISGDFDFQVAANSGYKAAFVITEDGVTGTTGYAQSNAYAGGGNGPMGGYELLPNPVPAAVMVYDHVARTIEPSFGGFAGSFPAVVAAGANHAVNHTIILPVDWDSDSIHIIVMLMAPNGQIDNAGKATIAEAVSNGFIQGTSTGGNIGLSEINQVDATFALYPNPATTEVAMTFNLKNESQVSVRVLDMAGKVLASKAYEAMNGASSISYNTSDLNQGIYTVEVTINGERITRRLVIQ
jgi:Secretion system C-terminal sorting domain/Outer membrane protein Omp28